MIAPRARQTELIYVTPLRGKRAPAGKASRRGFRVPSTGISASAAFALLGCLNGLGRRERCRAGNGPAIIAGWPQTRNASGAEILHHPTQIAMASRRAKAREAVVYVLPKTRIEIRALASACATGSPDLGRFWPRWDKRRSSVGLFMIWILLLLSPRL